jgi:hypothetical protein
MVWTDLNRWHWENLALPPGLRLAPFEATARLPEPVSARITLGPDGVVGTLTAGPFRDASDAVLAFPSHRNLAVRFTGAAGEFAAGPGDQLLSGQFLTANVLSGEQRRRQEVYRKLVARRTEAWYPTRPTLLTWASPLDLGFTFPEGTRQAGSALVAVPLTIDPHD